MRATFAGSRRVETGAFDPRTLYASNPTPDRSDPHGSAIAERQGDDVVGHARQEPHRISRRPE
jgi:hypothetical protein